MRHLQDRYQELYSDKDRKDFADGWQGFREITAAMDTATQAKQTDIPVQYPLTTQQTVSRVATASDPRFVHNKPSAIFEYDKNYGPSLLHSTQILQELHGVATGSSSTASQHKLWFRAHLVLAIKPLAPVPARVSAPTIRRRPVTPVTATAQPTARPTSSHTTPATDHPHLITFPQPATEQSPAAVPTRTRSVAWLPLNLVLIMQVTTTVTDLQLAPNLDHSGDLHPWPLQVLQSCETANSKCQT